MNTKFMPKLKEKSGEAEETYYKCGCRNHFYNMYSENIDIQ